MRKSDILPTEAFKKREWFSGLDEALIPIRHRRIGAKK
jgi:hypothetical protein